jgi:hypothetical protein
METRKQVRRDQGGMGSEVDDEVGRRIDDTPKQSMTIDRESISEPQCRTCHSSGIQTLIQSTLVQHTGADQRPHDMRRPLSLTVCGGGQWSLR